MISIDGYPIDAALAEEHTFDSEVTDFPVESGSDISDNARARPIVVSIDGIVSNTPLGDLATIRQQETAPSGVHEAPSNDAYARFLQIRDKREPVTIETSLQVFKNMMLTALTVPRDAKTGKALRFRATFKQIRFVTNARTTVRVSVPRAAPLANGGAKAGADKGGVTAKISFAGGQYTQDQIDSGEAATDAITKSLNAHVPNESASAPDLAFSHEDARNPCDVEFLENQKQGRDITDQQACQEIVLNHGQPLPESF